MATNRVFESGKVLHLAVGSDVESGDPVVVGELGGAVALTDYDSDSGGATLDFGGVYSLSVKGVNGGGNVAVAVGDALYYVAGDTPYLSKKATGVYFGNALEAIDSGATATIMVRSAGGGSAGASNGISVSAETTGTGASQNVAHGLGVVPSSVVVSLTEFASGQNVDVAEGTHTTTNVVLTVTSGVKFKVMAIR